MGHPLRMNSANTRRSASSNRQTATSWTSSVPDATRSPPCSATPRQSSCAQDALLFSASPPEERPGSPKAAPSGRSKFTSKYSQFGKHQKHVSFIYRPLTSSWTDLKFQHQLAPKYISNFSRLFFQLGFFDELTPLWTFSSVFDSFCVGLTEFSLKNVPWLVEPRLLLEHLILRNI